MGVSSIADVLCVPWVLLFTYVGSQICQTGWFGPLCKYKCRCINNKCSLNGECIGTSTCDGGWFGPACQYADHAYHTSDNPTVVDGKDWTCLVSNKTLIHIQLNESIYFTWLRAEVTHAGSDSLMSLSVSFWVITHRSDCTNMKKQIVNSTTLDIHCQLDDKTDNLMLVGRSAGHLCSVYVSGGRNVALKEIATQDSTYINTINGRNLSFTADLAVDGNTDPRFVIGLTCAHTAGRLAANESYPTWSVTLSKQRSVNRFVVYNRGDGRQSRLRGFALQAFTTPSQPCFSLRDPGTEIKKKYSIHHSPTPIQKVTIYGNGSERLLTLCEVEVYGDSICDGRHYGRECELECHCPKDEACFVATGGCPAPCPAGWHGPVCSRPCVPETFGEDCKSNCSQTCKPTHNVSLTSCHRMTGACVNGCRSGYLGASCARKCKAERFGVNCKSECSPACVAPDQANSSSCSHETGACLKGCRRGYTGVQCDNICRVGTFGHYCTSSCNKNCASNNYSYDPVCNHMTGECSVGCKIGFTGHNCTIAIKETDSKTLFYILNASLATAVASMICCYCCWTGKKTKRKRTEQKGGG